MSDLALDLTRWLAGDELMALFCAALGASLICSLFARELLRGDRHRWWRIMFAPLAFLSAAGPCVITVLAYDLKFMIIAYAAGALSVLLPALSFDLFFGVTE